MRLLRRGKAASPAVNCRLELVQCVYQRGLGASTLMSIKWRGELALTVKDKDVHVLKMGRSVHD